MMDFFWFESNDQLTLCLLRNFCFLSLTDFFQNLFFFKNSFRNTISVSDSLNPDPNCFQRLSADNTSRRRVKTIRIETVYHSRVFIIDSKNVEDAS